MKGRRILLCVLLFVMICPAVLARETAPRVEFYIDHYIGHVGRETSVTVLCRTPGRVTQDNNTFELRNHRGEVLATAQWRNPRQHLTIRFTVPESALGGNELSLWWNGADVTAEHAYAAYADPADHRVSRLQPQSPAISVIIVCGGGNAQDVEEILAVLDRHGVKCTFFFSGGWLESHVEEAKSIVAAGHEIGSHGYQHVHMPQLSSYRGMRNVITRMNRRCEELLGVRPRLFLAPYSDTDQKVTALARAEGMEEILWTTDSQDWKDANRRRPARIVQRVTGAAASPGAIIQFHLNGYNTAAVLDEVIPYYRYECGLAVVPVGQLLQLSGRELPPLPDIHGAAD